MIYLIAVNYYSTNLVGNLIQSIQVSNDVSYQIVIVNNSPKDSSIYYLKNDNTIVLEAGDNIGFGRACNLGLNWIYERDERAIVWIINPDAYLMDDALEEVRKFFSLHPQLSIVGTVIYTTTGEVWFAGGKFLPQTGAILSETVLPEEFGYPPKPPFLRGALHKSYFEKEWVSGCSLLLDLKNFSHCPQFDPKYFLYYEDFDFCRRYASQGHSIVITNQIKVAHQASAITNRNIALKFKYSTYSYLLTLERYTNKFILILRCTRILCHAFILIAVKPRTSFGKLHGVWLYVRRSLKPW